MSNFTIMADTTCDLGETYQQEYDIKAQKKRLSECRKRAEELETLLCKPQTPRT